MKNRIQCYNVRIRQFPWIDFKASLSDFLVLNAADMLVKPIHVHRGKEDLGTSLASLETWGLRFVTMTAPGGVSIGH